MKLLRRRRGRGQIRPNTCWKCEEIHQKQFGKEAKLFCLLLARFRDLVNGIVPLESNLVRPRFEFLRDRSSGRELVNSLFELPSFNLRSELLQPHFHGPAKHRNCRGISTVTKVVATFDISVGSRLRNTLWSNRSPNLREKPINRISIPTCRSNVGTILRRVIIGIERRDMGNGTKTTGLTRKKHAPLSAVTHIPETCNCIHGVVPCAAACALMHEDCQLVAPDRIFL